MIAFYSDDVEMKRRLLQKEFVTDHIIFPDFCYKPFSEMTDDEKFQIN